MTIELSYDINLTSRKSLLLSREVVPMSSSVVTQRVLEIAVTNPERVRPMGGQFTCVVLACGRRETVRNAAIVAHAKKKGVDPPMLAPRKRNRTKERVPPDQ